MHWLQTLDTDLFRFINLKLINPVFDEVMPFVSGNRFFFPLLLVLAVLLLWKGRARGIVAVLMISLVLAVGDGLICRNIKHAVGRPRPFVVLPETHRPGVAPINNEPKTDMAGGGQRASTQTAETKTVSSSGVAETAPAAKPNNKSMPSSHAANWFAAAMVAFIYYRRSIWFMLPAAVLVSFSRIYNGVHYPSDVVAGAILGAGYGAAIVWSLDALWRWAGQKWFPLWWSRFPSLLAPELRPEKSEDEEEFVPPPRRGLPEPGFRPPHVTLDQHWLRLGYICIAVLLLARLAYIASGTIQLSEDEAYQWVWSKHLALSYYSKPPLIAYTQFLGTSLWGDTVFGVRFFSPIISAILGLVLLRFFAREVNARAGFFLLLIVTATPLMAVGSILMTVDPLSVLFWVLAMLAGWRAVQQGGTTRDWLWVGLWMGLGFLSKYTELFQWLCWAVFFVLWRPARKHLRRPGPYLALVVNLLCAVPVLVWNAQHNWTTVGHVAADAKAGEPWHPTLKSLVEFLGSELGLLNPVFFVAMVWAAIAFWRRGRHNPRLVYLFSMGAPLFLSYLLFTFHSRVLPNWIAPSVVPLFCLMVIYWDTQWRLGQARLKGWLLAGLGLGLPLVILAHNSDPLAKLIGKPLPVNWDVLHRVREWPETAAVVEQARDKLLAEGKPVFIIASHYGIAGQLSFWIPEARAALNDKAPALVYTLSSPTPRNQFDFWPGYTERHGQNAIYVWELSRDNPAPREAPPQLEREFESVTSLGVYPVLYKKRYLLRPLQIFECRGAR